jgi:hypothetical protein
MVWRPSKLLLYFFGELVPRTCHQALPVSFYPFGRGKEEVRLESASMKIPMALL